MSKYLFTFSSDQIPFAVTLTQVNDKVKGDQTFIQNCAFVFAVAVHDPSSYLAYSDITFNWDFGDSSGTVISRELTVTHTYSKTGFFKPHVVVQAAILNLSCFTPTNTTPINYPTAHAFISEKHAGPVQLILTGRINITVITVTFLTCLNQRRLDDNKCFTHFLHTESVSEDTADLMEHSGSFSSDRKKAPQLDTNKGLFVLLILYTLGLHHSLYDYACCSISNCFQ